MRWILIFISLLHTAANVVNAQVTLLWSHRFADPTFFTGYGDVGTGLDLRHDSLLVGRTYENRSATTLLNAGTGDELWTAILPDTVVQYGGIHFLSSGIMRNDRVESASTLMERARTLGLDGSGQWSWPDNSSMVDQVCGPLLTSVGQQAYTLAYGQGSTMPELHGAVFDAAGNMGTWTYVPSHAWLALHALADDAGGIAVTAMVQYPSASSAVPVLARFSADNGSLLWMHALTDTTGFLVNSDAISAKWGSDTLLTAFTTWSGLVELRMHRISDGGLLWSFTDTLGLIPYLSTLCAEPGEQLIHIGTENSFVLTYDADAGRLWMDTLYTSPHYDNSVLLADGQRFVHVLATGPGLGQGQDIRIRTFDKQTGEVTGDATWNDPVSNTHDILHHALLAHDTLYVLSASTYDTLSILNERTTLTVNAYLLGGATGIPTWAIASHSTTATLAHDGISILLASTVRTWTCFDLSGRIRFRGNGVDLDEGYGTLAPGLYLFAPSDGTARRLFEKY